MGATARKSAPISINNAARQTLADAIEKREQLKRFKASLEAASESAMQETWALNADLPKAQELIPEAEARLVDSHVSRTMGKEVEAGQTVAEAKEAVADIQTKIDASRAARELLNKKRASVEKDLEYATSAVHAARSEVLRTSDEVKQLAIRYREVAVEFATLRVLFDRVVGTAVSESDRIPIRPADQAAISAWESAIRLLENDPNASLPEN